MPSFSHPLTPGSRLPSVTMRNVFRSAAICLFWLAPAAGVAYHGDVILGRYAGPKLWNFVTGMIAGGGIVSSLALREFFIRERQLLRGVAEQRLERLSRSHGYSSDRAKRLSLVRGRRPSHNSS
jgi:hypothetical protein